MSIRICTYNIEWFENQFMPDNSLKQLDPNHPEDDKLIKQRNGLAILFDQNKLEIGHSPGRANSKSRPKFNGQFFFDTDDDRIKEPYKFYRPPLEDKIKIKTTNQEFYLILDHAKSKGIFDTMDMLHWEREN